MQLLLIAGAVLVAVAVGLRLWERVMAGGVQQRGQSTPVEIGRPRRMAGRVLVTVGGLSLVVLPLVWIAAADEPWHQFDNDRQVVLAVAWLFTLVVEGVLLGGALLLGVVGHRGGSP